MWDRTIITAGVKTSLDTIFAAVIVGDLTNNKGDAAKQELLERKNKVKQVCLKRFSSEFTFNIFYNNYAIFYEIIETLNCNTFTQAQLMSIIDTNRDLILNSPYIDISKYSRTDSGNLASDDDIINAVTCDLVESLIELSNMYVDEEDFKSACVTYTSWYKNAFAEYTALNMSAIMTDTGLEIKLPGKRKRTYKGLQDMMEYYNSNMRIIKSLSEENRVKSCVIDSKWVEQQILNESNEDKNELFTTNISKIDNTLGALRRGNMIGIMGPPKGGKTKFANYLTSLALINGLNVCVWPLEGTVEEWESMQVAAHIAIVSFAKAQKSGNKDEFISIASDDILRRKYVGSLEHRQLVNGARMNIANGEGIGRLSFMSGTAYVESMFDELLAHYENENPFDVLVIDSLVNVMSRKGMGKVERISEAYMKTKDFISNVLSRPALGIMPAQLKQETIDFLRRNPDETIDVTGGGESAETIRTPDTTIGLFSTKQERENNLMKFYCVATRHSAAFPDFSAHCRLGSCLFYDGEED